LKHHWKNILFYTQVPVVLTLCSISPLIGTNSGINHSSFQNLTKTDTLKVDTVKKLPYYFKDEGAFEYPNSSDSSKLYLRRPANIKTEIKYDPVSEEYVFYETVNGMEYRLPKVMTRAEYQKYEFEEAIKNYWRNRKQQPFLEKKGGLLAGLNVGGETFNKVFGGNTVDVHAQGYVYVDFGYQLTKNDNPSIAENLRKVPTFNFDQKIQVSLTGKVGTKLNMNLNYNTEATFDFENKMNINYAGDDDQIIKKVEAGNVSLPLSGTLITGASNLFGVKTEMQFGKLNVTALFSQSKGETKSVELSGGAQKKSFEIDAYNYDANRHFFLSQYFRDHYDEALKNLPAVNTPIKINKIEVWVTNKSGSYTSSRNILALMDLGEHKAHIYNTITAFKENSGLAYPETVYPFNNANGLYKSIINDYSGIRTVSKITKTLSSLKTSNFAGGQDYEKVEQARLLSSSEYTINEELGYISLNSALSMDEVLAVAYNYTANGETYQVGEFSTDGIDDPKTLIVKMLKSTNQVPKIPTWDLMMKNIYSIGATDITKDDFTLNVLYLNSSGNYINYFPAGTIAGHNLLSIMRLDRLDSQNDLGKDGAFDFVDGITINKTKGRIIFPVVEPFGSHLKDSISNDVLAKKYIFQSLYDSTQVYAQQDADHDKYELKGFYKGTSSSEISIGSTNLAKGSVTVSSGGIVLTENVDYIVDYTAGKIKIINQSLIDTGTSLTISTETQNLYSASRKTLMGTHANYVFNKKLNLGGTFLYMQENPVTTKVNYGDDPIANVMFGLDGSYNSESNLITKLVNKLPFIQTKEKSSIALDGEFAQLVPGHSKVVGSSGTSYIDDFESTKTSIDMRTVTKWKLASTPQGQASLFPEGDLYDDLAYGYNRAKLAWYNIDATLVRGGSSAPSNLRGTSAYEELSNHYVREVYQEEIFPDKETETGVSTKISTFDLAYYPEEKGPYNYDVNSTTYSSGITSTGLLKNPQNRWGGIMRSNPVTNFETANIAYIEFWLMDPFIYNTDGTAEGGNLYFDLGEVSEDILKDGEKAYENGLPSSSTVTKVDSTIWGRVSTIQSTAYSFSGGDDARKYQDVGLDGLSDTDEQSFFSNYLSKLSTVVDADTYATMKSDPASDDYHYFKGTDYDADKLGVLQRYKKYNGLEGNSTATDGTAGSTDPDVEDISSDNTMNENERYYQYKVGLHPSDMVLGKNYIVDIKEGEKVTLKNGTTDQVKWYQFRIPLKTPDSTIGTISGFKSIRFTRLFMRDFKTPVYLRFATLDLVRADWRKYTGTIQDDSSSSTSSSEFDLSAVSIEENSSREPVNYILPPGIERTTSTSSSEIILNDEQSLDLKVIGLEAGYSQAAYKSTDLDLRNYKRLIMDVHAEQIDGYSLSDDDLSLFLRFGTDYNTNYYEYEVPLKLTPEGSYSGSSTSDRYIVWPDENRINVALSAFTEAKKARNAAIKLNSSLSTSDVYKVANSDWLDGRDTVRVKGNPSLSDVEVLMIGIRHKKKKLDTGTKTVEVWANELRLSGYNEEGGWAAKAHAAVKMADLGTVNVAVSHSTAGFGTISSKVNQRSMDDVSEVDVAANLELGKFFPAKSGVKIPTYVGYSQTISNPKYNPLDKDLTMKESLAALTTKAEKDSLKRLAQEVTEQKSISFTNVKVDRTLRKGKVSPFDPANLSLSFSYNETYSRDVDTEYNTARTYKASLTYNYNLKPKPIEPFKNIKVLSSSDVLKLIRDFNFYLYPSQVAYRMSIYRYYNEIQTRDISNTSLSISPTYNKIFKIYRYFDMNFDLSNSLKMTFSSQNTSKVDEPTGRMNRHDDDYQAKRDSIFRSLLKLGRPTNYAHSINATYNVPLNKIKLLNWTSVMASYRGTYEWTVGSTTTSTIELGNVIQNSKTLQVNGQFNLVSLYNKVNFLKDVNQKFGKNTRQSSMGNRQQKMPSKSKTPEKQVPEQTVVNYVAENVKIIRNSPKSVFHKLNTSDVEVKVYNKKGKEVEGKVNVVNANRITFTSPKTLDSLKIVVKGFIQPKENPWLKMAQISARALMSVRNLTVNYSINEGTYVPGFLPSPDVFGFGSGHYNPDPKVYGTNLGMSDAPGIPFLLGWQNDKFMSKAITKGWITKDTTLNDAFIMNRTETFNFRSSVEPVADLRLVLTATRIFAQKMSEYCVYNNTSNSFITSNRTFSGSFSMSINTTRTTFTKMRGSGVPESKAYDNFKQYRQTISRRLAAARVANKSASYDPSTLDSDGEYSDGYGSTSQLVMIPAFIAAYTGQSPEKVSLCPFPSLKYLRPNWQLTYDGLVSKIDGLKNLMNTLSISHSYRSTYSIASYTSNLSYDDSSYGDGFNYVRNSANNFLGLYDFSSVNITEQMNPLLSISVTWKNDLQTEVGITRTRNITLSLDNNRVTELLQNQINFGLGYRFTKMDLIVKTKKSQKAYSNDLNLKANLSIARNKTILRQIEEGDDQLSAGQNTITLKTSADYMLNSQLQMSLYYDKVINEPLVSSYKTSTTNFGVSFKFTLTK
jgi:cell surface protein SprA